mgnify:CR=1 FL=1
MNPQFETFLSTVDTFAERLNRLVESVVGINMILLTVVIFAQVFFRYVLRDSIPWSAEVARYLFISVVFLGLSSAYRRGEHLGFTVLMERSNAKWTSIILMVIHLLVMVLMIILVVFGYKAAVHAGRQISPGLQVKMSVPYAIVPIGAFLVTVQLIPILLREWSRAFFSHSRI